MALYSVVRMLFNNTIEELLVQQTEHVNEDNEVTNGQQGHSCDPDDVGSYNAPRAYQPGVTVSARMNSDSREIYSSRPGLRALPTQLPSSSRAHVLTWESAGLPLCGACSPE